MLVLILVAALNAVIFCVAVGVIMPRQSPSQRLRRRLMLIFGALFPIWILPVLRLAAMLIRPITATYGYETGQIVGALAAFSVTPIAIFLIGGPRRSVPAAALSFGLGAMVPILTRDAWSLMMLLIIWHVGHFAALSMLARASAEPESEPVCERCRYPVRGLDSPRCPECGGDITI